MSASDDSPSSWQFMLQDIEVTPSKSEVPGGEGKPSAQMDSDALSLSVRETVVIDEVSVVYVRSGPGVDVCGGRIGNSKAKFCVAPCEKGSTVCRYTSHTTKVDVVFPGYFIRAVKGTTAFCEPCLAVPEHGFSEVILQTLQGKRSTIEWTKIFPTIATAATLDNDLQADMLARGERAVAMGPTPMKRRVMFTSDDVEDEYEREQHGASEEEEASQNSTKLLVGAIVEPGTSLEKTLVQVATYWNEVVASSITQLSLLRVLETDVRSDMEEVDDKVVQVSSMLGSKPPGSSMPLTLWASMSAISEEVSAFNARSASQFIDTKTEAAELSAKMEVLGSEVAGVHALVESQVRPVVVQLGAAIKELQRKTMSAASAGGQSHDSDAVSNIAEEQKVTKAVMDDITKVMGDVIKKQDKDELDIANLKRLIGTQNGRPVGSEVSELRSMYQVLVDKITNPIQLGSGMHRSAEESLKRSLEDMRRELQMVREQVDTRGSGGSLEGSSGLEQALFIVQAEVATLRDQVADLEVDNAKIRSEIITDTISFGGHYFLTEDAYIQFVVTHFPKGQTHFLMDFISMCECASTRNRSTAEGLKNMKMLQGAGFENGNEGTVFASFGTVFPMLFGEEHDARDPSKKMGSMTDMREWDPNTNRAGRKNQINTALTNFKRATELQITALFGQATVPALFFKCLLQSTWSFWEALASWITHFENEMVSQMGAENSPAQKAQVWNLICWLLHSMFTEMEVRRAPGGVAQSVEKTNTAGRCAAILHGTLCGHKFMTELMDANFSRHPLFAATMSEFLMTTKASVIVLEEVKTTAKSALVAVRALQSEKDKKGKRGAGQDNQ